jgi:phosphoglycolate phosphatase-like HAD superfamily hydrolase
VTTALLWDIDGTLLTTARAGVFALEEAAEELGATTAVDLQALRTAGLTDAEVAALCLRESGLPDDPETVSRFLRAYEQRLPGALHRRAGHVMPGVREVLDDLAGRDDVVSLLLTGNTPNGARAKLAHYDLARYFERGAFCEAGEPREEIAARAAELAGPGAKLVVVGDTPHDIRCARAVGSRVLAVATGGYSAEELAAYEPDAVLEQLPEPSAFRRLAGIE